MNNLTIIDGVECYELDGTAYLKLETVARGLGFTQSKNGVEYIRWKTVDRYLNEFGFPNKLGNVSGFATNGERPEFIPENIFYRLAMKAKNSVAEAFQAKVADEIIPAIRKTGSYTMPDALPERPLTRDDYIAAAKILAGCRNERLPIVVTMLDKAGLDMSEVKSPVAAGEEADPKIGEYEQEHMRAVLSRYTDTYAAEKLGLSRGIINMYRHGSRAPRRARYLYMMDVLDNTETE